MKMTYSIIKKFGKLIIALSLMGFIVYKLVDKPDDKPLELSIPNVITAPPKLMKMAEYIKQTGNISAFNSVDLVARVEGYLQGINFKDGTFVTKDKELFVIEPRPYQEKLNEAQASVKAAKAGLNYAKAEYARQQRMYEKNATSQNSVEAWQSKMQQAQAELSQSQSNLINAQINYGYTHVNAPFDGRIGRHLVDEGNLVGNGQATKLATIEQISPIYVYFNLNELDLLKLRAIAKKRGFTHNNISKINIEVGLQNEKGYPHKGTLNFVNTSLNPSTGTMEFRGLIENKNKLFIPGLFVNIRMAISPPKPMLTVPSNALLYDQIGPYVLTVSKDQKAELKRVTLGSVEQNRQAITQGLQANSQVIIKGLQFIAPGSAVSVEMKKERIL